MLILFMFFLVPMAAGTVLEYVFCRFPKRRFWRFFPPIGVAVLAAAVTLFRYFGWDEGGGGAPLETLLLFPGLPMVGLFAGIFTGWRVWKRLWTPRVIQKKKQK